MPDFESGVKGYVVAEATVRVNFPIDFKGNTDITCTRCPYLSSNERLCQLNKEVVAYPHKYVGANCPLVEVKSINKEE